MKTLEEHIIYNLERKVLNQKETIARQVEINRKLEITAGRQSRSIRNLKRTRKKINKLEEEIKVLTESLNNLSGKYNKLTRKLSKNK